MRKLIIAVKSCHQDRDRGFHDVIRKTWGATAKAAGIEVRFFMGANERPSSQLLNDEVELRCADTYADLPFKTREICRWARGKVTDHIFLCDTDTYIFIPYLLAFEYEKFDYMGEMPYRIGTTFLYESDAPGGHREVRPDCNTWASGGVGYFLSKRASNEIAESFPDSWAEDLWVGQIIMPLVYKSGYKAMNTRENNYTGSIFSWHFPAEAYKEKYDPKFRWMEEMHGAAR